jgi:ATP/ADP translocase
MVMPWALLFTRVSAKDNHFTSNEKLFHAIIGIFMTFFRIFGFVIHPNVHIFPLAVATVGLGNINVINPCVRSIYVMAEL